MGKKKKERILIPFGMFGAMCYLAYVIAGTGFSEAFGLTGAGVSALTAKGSTGAVWLWVAATMSWLGMLAFSAGMLMRANRSYNRVLWIAYMLFLNLQVLLIAGFGLFPLNGALAAYGGTNTVHIVIIALAAVAANAFAFLAGFGYYKQPERKRLGVNCLFWAILITAVNIASAVAIAFRVTFFGLGERAMLFMLMCLIFSISYTETFSVTRYNRIIKED